MNEREINDVIERARRALSPTGADAQRVRARVQLATSLPSASGDVGGSGSGAATAAWPLKLPVLIAVAGLSGALGYYAGYRTARIDDARARERAENAATAKAMETSSAVHAPVPDATATPVGPRALAGTTTAANAARSPLPEHVAHTARPPRSREHLAQEPAEAAGEAPATDTPDSNQPSPSPSPSPSLEVEIEALHGIELALRQGRFRLALSRLSALDREVPNGQLGEERLAASVIARCRLGLADPAALRIEFSQRYPGSIYFARVKQACPLAGHTP